MNEYRQAKAHTTYSFMTLFLSLCLGVMLSLPFRVIDKVEAESKPSESRQELASMLSKLQAENEQLRMDLQQTRDRESSLEKALYENQEASKELGSNRLLWRTLAGLEAVQGPGIRLTLSEGQVDMSMGQDAAPYLIHQEDLLNIVNELWLAGAEAIAIQSGNKIERLVMDSTIRCVGSLIDINNTRMVPPFDILAIGNPDYMISSLNMPGGVLQPLSFFNINAVIVKEDNLTLPAYSGSTVLEYAEPIKKE